MKMALLICFAATLSACAFTTSDIAVPLNGIYRGRYIKQFEVSSFQPCGSSEKWWVTGRVEPLIARLTLGGFVGGVAYVELRGRVSSRGQHGHLGGYPREFTVEQVLLVRPHRSSDCP
jgi:hypothetical protein